MDKYEYKVRSEEISKLIEKEKYAEAVKIADTIDWRRVKSAAMLLKIAALYRISRRNEDSREMLMLAYERYPTNRSVVYSLCELSIELDDVVAAIEYYKQFVKLAPKDNGVYTLRYRILEAQEASLEERIEILEELKKKDYQEEWAYELAYLYHRVGLSTKCAEECDDIILWFGDGPYVMKAMELKAKHVPLTEAQQQNYDIMLGNAGQNYSGENYNAENYDAESYDEQNYNTEGYDEQNYYAESYDEANYNAGNYDGQNYDAEGYDAGSYDAPNYNNESYGAGRYDTAGYEGQDYEDGNEPYEQEGYADEVYANAPYGNEAYADGDTGQADYSNEQYTSDGYGQENYTGQQYDDGNYAQNNYVDDGYGNLSYVDDTYQDNGYTSEFYVEQIYDENGNLVNPEIYTDNNYSQESYPYPQDESFQENSYDSQPSTSREYRNGLHLVENTAAPSGNSSDMSQYNTINLQKVVAESMKELFPDDNDDVFAEDREKYNSGQTVRDSSGDTRIFADNVERNTVRKQQDNPTDTSDSPAAYQTTGRINVAQMVTSVSETAPEPHTGAIKKVFVPGDDARSIKTDFNMEELRDTTEKSVDDEHTRMEHNDENVYHEHSLMDTGDTDEPPHAQTGPMKLDNVLVEWERLKQDNAKKNQEIIKKRVLTQTGRIFADFDNSIKSGILGELEREEAEAERNENSAKKNRDGFLDADVTGDILQQPASDNDFDVEYVTDHTQPAKEQNPPKSEDFVKSAESMHIEKSVPEVTAGTTDYEDAVDTKETDEDDTDYMTEPDTAAKTADNEPNAHTQELYEEAAANHETDTYTQKISSDYILSSIDDADDYPEETDDYAEKTDAENEYGNFGKTDAINIEAYTEEANAERLDAYTETAPIEDVGDYIVDTDAEDTDDEYPAETDAEDMDTYTGTDDEESAGEYTAELYLEDADEYTGDEEIENADGDTDAFYADDTYDDLDNAYSDTSDDSRYAEIRQNERYNENDLDPEDAESIAEMAKEDALKTQEIKMNTADLSSLSEKIVATTKKEASGAKREEIRDFTPEEQTLFENFAVTKKIKKQIIYALENMTLAAYTGNVIITGDAGLDTVRMAKNLIKEYQACDESFSGKLAKITGEKINQRNIKDVFEKLSNGGIIIEKANGMNEEKLYELAINLNQDTLGIVVIMEDTKKEITKLLEKQAMIMDYFNIRIDLMEMDTNALVAYAKNYALALEYSIDELGTLALYTRIANMQSGNHVVTKDEVRDIIDEAIWKSKKSKIKNFVDVLFARRYDNEDMIVLKERDFM